MRSRWPVPRPIEGLGAQLRARRRERRLSLRDLADEINVSFNTLSRVERGHVPDLRNFRRIIDWLGVPAERYLEPEETPSTPGAIARHLHMDPRLTPEAAEEIHRLVEDMYESLARPKVAVHLRSAQTFTPQAAPLLAEILQEMSVALSSEQ
jgi:transcriptional regulator with XRE-family HTH domain